MPTRNRPRALGLQVLAYAWFAARPRTAEEAEACNLQFSRTRDFLVQAPAVNFIIGDTHVSAGEFEWNREAALAEMRHRCASCGLCVAVGLKPP